MRRSQIEEIALEILEAEDMLEENELDSFVVSNEESSIDLVDFLQEFVRIVERKN